MEKMNFRTAQMSIPDTVPSYNEIVRMRVEAYNALTGQLKDYDCPECLNKGYIARQIGDRDVMSECKCMKIRRTLSRIRESGLENQLKNCTFKSFETLSDWQKQMKNAAAEFLESNSVGFFIGGQSGCGKTHICTALVGGFIKKGLSARYFVWRDDSTMLKALVNDREYSERVNEFKQADVLYIDDLFKQDEIKDADKKLAFEIIDYRVRGRLKTIISTELSDEDLIRCDEALAGRIIEISKGFRLVIPKDRRKNYRLK